MNVVKKTLGQLALYSLLPAINIIPCANIIPEAFPTRNVSTLYLLFLYCLSSSNKKNRKTLNLNRDHRVYTV